MISTVPVTQHDQQRDGGVFDYISPSRAVTSTPSTPAGSTTAPAGAARCATTVSRSAGRGRDEQPAGRATSTINNREVHRGRIACSVRHRLGSRLLHLSRRQTNRLDQGLQRGPCSWPPPTLTHESAPGPCRASHAAPGRGRFLYVSEVGHRVFASLHPR